MDALKEKYRFKNITKNNKEEIQAYKEKENNIDEEMSRLKFYLEEAKRVEEVLTKQLQENENHCEKLDSEVITLRKDLEKTKSQLNLNLKFGKGSKTLEKIINNQ